MPQRFPSSASFITLSVISLLALAGCSKPLDTKPLDTAEAASPAAASQGKPTTPAKTPSKVGDLAAFRTIAADVATIVDKGDLPAAKLRIKDLELMWDSAEAGLKPRAADDWHTLDKAIDHALAALRADSPKQADCQHRMADLLHIFDTLQGKA